MTLRQSQVRVLGVKEFSQICRTTARTLRFYAKKGVLVPVMVDEDTGYRYYASQQARDFLRIKLLQSYGLSLDEIKQAIKQKSLDALIKEELQQMERAVEEQQKELSFLRDMQSLLFGKTIKNQLKELTIGPFNLFCYDIYYGYYDQIGEYLSILAHEARKHQVPTRKEELVFYQTAEYKPQHAHLEVALITKGAYLVPRLPADFYFRSMPATKVLQYTYTGPYEFMPLVFQKVEEAIVDSKRKIIGPAFDMYVDGPSTEESKYDFVTKLVFPVA